MSNHETEGVVDAGTGTSGVHRGEPLGAAEPTAVYAATLDGATLTLSVASGKIVRASYEGLTDASIRAAADALCEVVSGLPMQEAADHGALRALYRLRGVSAPRPVAGILAPRNASPALAFLERLVRAVHGRFLAMTGATGVMNTYADPVSSGWARTSTGEKLARLQSIVDGLAPGLGLASGDVALEDVERHVRVTVRFGSGVPAQRKPVVMRALERALRGATTEPIELFMAERQDENKLRRLKTTE